MEGICNKEKPDGGKGSFRLFHDAKPHEFNLGGCVLDNLKFPMAELHDFVQLRETLIFVQDEAAEGDVFLALGQVKTETLVDGFDFHACGKQVFVVAKVLGNVFVVVVLVLDFAENLFHKVFQRDDAAGASELVDNDGHGFLLLHKLLHQFLCRHGLGNDGDFADASCPVGMLVEAEHFAGMDKACNVVEVFAVDDNLGMPALDELAFQGLERGVDADGVDFRSGHDAVAYLGAAEVQGILEYLDLLVNLVFVRRIHVSLDEVVKVYLCEGLSVGSGLHLGAHHPEECLGQSARKLADGVEEDVEKECRQGKGIHHAVGVEVEYGLGQELSRHEHDERAEQRLYGQLQGAVVQYARGLEDEDIDDARHEDAVEHQRDVVADEQGGDEVVGMGIEYAEYAGGQSLLGHFVNLHTQLAARHESDFQPRKEGGQQQDEDATGNEHRRKLRVKS